MKPDGARPRPLSGTEEPAHLRAPGDDTHHIWRYAPSEHLRGLVHRYWIPVWSIPAGQESVQHVLQHPAALLVIHADHAHFSGVDPGLSSVTLRGDGYAVGVLFRAAAGALVSGGSMADWTDRSAPLSDVLSDGDRLVGAVQEAMRTDPNATAAHLAAIDALESTLERFVPIDADGELVNVVVEFVEAHSEVVRVQQICEHFAIGERALQRLTRDRIGITPKWLIRRRRLHEATEALRAGTEPIAAIAARLGYADQAHFTRDLRATTTLTPRQIADRFGVPRA